ncbi:PAS domain S-box protein [Pontibacter oryzae]|uniref:histidine kinase n=1 Tax=Pontibacter oryzae TaxID=2304593 RepID=A0A399SGR8_9BACT|nr:PAS domain S-box protein [Pontibacter oryzae]RIJ42408.1 PAS domain S-box protein [Pontibacter oryzae]
MQSHSLEFYRSVVSNSMDLISVVDKAGKYTFVGESAKVILGYAPQELIGTEAYRFIHPDEQMRVDLLMRNLPVQRKVRIPAFRFLSKTGQWRWLECTATNMLHDRHVRGILINSRDVTEEAKLGYDKDYHQAYYKSLFFEHPDAVFTVNLKGTFQQVNQHMHSLTGYNDNQLHGMPYAKLVAPHSLAAANTAFTKVLNGLAHSVEICIVTADGVEKEVSVTVMPVYFRGELQGVQGIAKDVTEVNRTQKLIQEQAQQLNNILESISEPFYALDDEWRFTFVSAAFASFKGMDRSELVGKCIWEECPYLLNSRFYQQCLDVAQHKTTLHFEETFTSPKPCILHFTIYPTPDGIAVHFVDVTLQKRTEQEIKKLSFVASKTINGVVIMDPDRNIEWVNDGFCRLTGYNRQEVIGRKPSEMLQGPETDKKVAAQILEKYRSQKPFSEEILNYKKSGEKVWFYIDVTPIFDQFDNLVNYIALETDITEKKEAEKKLLKLADDLYKQNRDLQQFTYIISHNLRAPVANALGLAQLVKRLPKETETYDVALQKLYFSVQSLDSVIKDMNNVLSIRDSGRTSPREAVNLKQVCNEVLEHFEKQLSYAGAKVHVSIDPALKLASIRAYLYSILHNLLSNALKYKAEARPLEIRITAERDKRGYALTVADNGTGLDMHVVHSQLFQLYKRFHPELPGKGIGLFLVKTQVEALGGKITVDSEPDKGTTFKILLGAKHVQ